MPAWAPTRALGRAVLLTGTLILAAALLGRLDLVVVAVPFALGTAWALRRLPAGAPRITLAVPTTVLTEGTETTAAVVAENPQPVAIDLVVLSLAQSRWLPLHDAGGPARRCFATWLAAGQTAGVELTARALRWGPHQVGPVNGYAAACHGLLLTMLEPAPSAKVRVHPQTAPFTADEAMPRASGLVGIHRSRRPGEGGELAGVRRYGPGDRLRRIDWRVTLRTREPHIVQTLSDRDAEVMIVLDVVREAGRSGGVFGAPSVLDTTVRAAAAIAEHYLRQGDRVGLLEYSGHPRQLRAASGRRQFQAALEWLLTVRVSQPPAGAGSLALDPQVVSGSALVVVLTPLLAAGSTEVIARLARAGRVVVAVDTLGETRAPVGDGSPWTPLAVRLWRLERENTIDALLEAGVPVATWRGTGSLDAVLRDLTRMAAAPRMSMR